jgi:hypothetical protein
MAHNKGICAICGKGTKLSLEHVPPRCAGNDKPVEVNTFEDWEAAGGKLDEMKDARPQSKGIGYVTICKKCNEDQGAHYVPTFCRTVNAGLSILKQLPISDFDKDVEATVVEFGVKGMQPLPFVKEIVAMLLAMNGEFDPEFRPDNDELVRFVRDKDVSGLSEKYHLYLSLFVGPVNRFAPVMAAIIQGHELVLTAVDYPPFSYVMTIGNSAEYLPVGDITPLASAAFDETRDVTFTLICGFGHTPFPLDYRSRARVKADDEAGKKHVSVHVKAVKSDGTIISE